MYSQSQLLEEEAKQVHKRFKDRRVDWATLYLEVKYFYDDDIYPMDSLTLLIRKLYNQMFEDDKGETT